MLSMLISIESILYILFLEKYFFLKFYQYSPYLKQRHPREAPPSSSTTLKQHKYWFRQPTHPFIYLTLRPCKDEHEHKNDEWDDHTKRNTNKKTMNETPTQRQTQNRKRRMRHPCEDEPDHTEIQHGNTRSSSKSWRLHHHKGCWWIKETAKPQRVPMPHNYEKQDGTITSNMPSKGCARYCISNHPRGCWSAGIHTT
jgi:hypothetical protein